MPWGCFLVLCVELLIDGQDDICLHIKEAGFLITCMSWFQWRAECEGSFTREAETWVREGGETESSCMVVMTHQAYEDKARSTPARHHKPALGVMIVEAFDESSG